MRGEDLESIKLMRQFIKYFWSILAVTFFSIVYKMIIDKNIKEKRDIKLKNEYLLTEMKFLKSQINPHFLFNSLNNIYALVSIKDVKAPDMLMKLSEMLRYMLYECNDDFVPLEKEIHYIKNYIELQHLKTEKRQNINTNFNTNGNSINIPPLLLIPFIENSFKHSRIENINKGMVTMQLDISDRSIYFKIVNSMPGTKVSNDKTGGIGLENVKRRLELLYKNNYKLDINKTEKEFIVELNIDFQLSLNNYCK